jgi:DNA-binding PadR family transcriptional regulator
MEWLTSGLRRDLCILLYGDEWRAQSLKSALEDRYDRRIKPDRFYGALESLDSKGFVETHVEGLEDVHSLTEPGRRSVETQLEWFREQVETPPADD